MPLTALIEHLQTDPLASRIDTLQKAIGGSADQGPCVYFAASYERIARIAKSGEILPRNAVHDLDPETEISSTAVQKRRDDVDLGDGVRKRPPKKVHDCLNFFFNPYNSSIFALSRNALIVGGSPLQIGILEIPLKRISKLLHERDGLWACTTKNVAANGCWSRGIVAEVTGDWPWREIFECSDDHQQHQPRAAEFLLWLNGGDGAHSSGLPIGVVSRILVPEDSLLEPLPETPRSHYLKFADHRTYLTHEGRLRDFDRRQAFKLCNCLENFAEAAAELPIHLSVDQFASPQIALSRIHGIPHVTRVMLWTHYLSQPAFLLYTLPRTGQFSDFAPDPDFSQSIDHLAFFEQASPLAKDALLAAAIHDLRRETDNEDTHHGEDAANHFSDTITAFCGGDQARITRIKEAVTWHCRDDKNCPDQTNPVWMILKDADALDRGRFSGPCEGADFQGTGCSSEYCKEHKGCAYPTLRLNYEGIGSRNPSWPFRKNLAMAAWRLAKATGNAPWHMGDATNFLSQWLFKAFGRLDN